MPETVENAVSGREDFHFYVDELTQNGIMPTYAGEGNLYGFLGWTMGNIHDPKVKEKAIAAMKAELEGGE